MIDEGLQLGVIACELLELLCESVDVYPLDCLSECRSRWSDQCEVLEELDLVDVTRRLLCVEEEFETEVVVLFLITVNHVQSTTLPEQEL